MDYWSIPRTSKIALPSCVISNTPFQGLSFYNMRVELNDTKGHFQLWKPMVPWLWTIMKIYRLISGCFKDCLRHPVFSKAHITAQNIDPMSGNEAGIFPRCPWGFCFFFTIPLPITKVIWGIHFTESCWDLISEVQSRRLYLFKNKMLRKRPFILKFEWNISSHYQLKGMQFNRYFPLAG